MNKATIKSFAIEARKKLISEISYRAGLVGINKDGISEPIHKASSIEMYDIGGNEPYSIKGNEISQRQSLAIMVRNKGFDNVIEEVAYTWFNRIIAIRFMEVNDYLPTRVRVLSSENKDKIEPDIVTEAPNVELGFKPNEINEILQLKHDNKLDELFRFLFIKECNALNDILPELFEKTSDYTELLLSISFTNEDSIVRYLVRSINEEDFREQVEIIGWLYQYYNTELKDETFALLKKNVKITKERIPSATQLFTPDWIVRYMVENSLGRVWVEGHYDSDIKDSWKYYIGEADQEEEVKVYLDNIRKERKYIKPEEIKFIDPCMGSGHVLVYAFDVFMDIYKSYGYSEREAAKLILQNNIYGIDIDDRAYQLAYFALMMKARSYDRRILNSNIIPNLSSIKESNALSKFEALDSQVKLDDINFETANYLIGVFKDAKEYGSILNIKKRDYEGLQASLDKIIEHGADDIFEIQWINSIKETMPALIRQARILSQKYDSVVTNPPYMGKNGMSEKLVEYTKTNYTTTKSDMSTIFMEKTLDMCKPNGYMAMINIPVWMFLSSYKKLRETLILSKTFINMLHFGRGVFGADFGTTAFVISNSNIDRFNANYRRLFQKQGAVDRIEQKEEWFFNGLGSYIAQKENFLNIPDMPIAYWVSEKIVEAFRKGEDITKYIDTFQGIITGDNTRFLRNWHEVEISKIPFDKKKMSDIDLKNQYWIPYNKGGEFRNWYGNQEYVVNWRNGPDDKTRGRKTFQDHYLREYISWSYITSSTLATRYFPSGFLWDVHGSGIFDKSNNLKYLQAFISSKVGIEFLKIINPTISYQVENIAQLPVIISKAHKNRIDDLVSQNIEISKAEWDTFEISWNFITHPFLKYNNKTILSSFSDWDELTQRQYVKLKENEEELDRIFIEIYEFQDELTPEENRNISIRKAECARDVKSFISYAVGCMFGRYSLDNNGLVYAGGEWDANKYKTFAPDKDNVIPITDEEYFNDDIVGRFVEFVKVTYGDGRIEENLEFIAKSLGNNGDNSREVIRNYILKDFYKDHVKTYQKKPIYWMFDSGKENGFKALIYMHRYNEDTVAKVRTNYLHKVQKAIESAIESADIIIDSASSSTQKAKVVKQKEKLVKQLSETRIYDSAIGHVASQRIGIDLDDGVIANYAKFQGVEISKEGKKASKIDLLSKI